jgi:CheY-like chemotaxis protein
MPTPNTNTPQERILLVEDEEEVRKFVRIMLEKQGYGILEAANTYDALRLGARADDQIDLRLTDVMPRDKWARTGRAHKPAPARAQGFIHVRVHCRAQQIYEADERQNRV